ncbi:FkbM family methyltransferase [Paraburkholderia tuberum]|uniref:Methyltransferase, FkbM family n=1 Tax=Paraburkholderia tuberum TaxID=157910 RepID=A0A1H1IVU1_9BURK|nr:FkbM family methyltransferase [Paraburkholderia tuberum]SDR41831.1 methyltransferase, FkbM family [Paraburkholderia tuberum]
MTVDQRAQQKLEARLKDVTEENDLLLGQLHQVQGVLERHYLQSRELEKQQTSAVVQNVVPSKDWVHAELLDALAENCRLQALAQAQKKVHRLETQNALTSKLGNILIRGTDSPASLFSVPGKLAKIWRQSGQQTPPKLLGGKSFDKLIEAYGKGGLDAAEKLLAGASIGPVMQANAYTVLARNLMNSDRTNAAMAARRAYEIDPKPYRLKWLAFRLHEIGKVIEAEAMLKILPPDTPFSESEARQANQVGHEARDARRSETEQSSDFVERRARIEKQLTSLSRKLDEQAKLAAVRGREVEVLKQAKAQLEREKTALSGKHDEQTKLAAERGREVDVLKLVNARLEQDKAALSGKHDEQTKLAAQRGREVDVLKLVNAHLEQDKAALSGKHDEQTKLAAQRGYEVEVLKHANAQLAQEKAALSGKHDEQTKLAAQRGYEVEVLKHANAQLAQEKAALSGKHDEQTKLAAERGREVEVLKQAKAQLEQQKAALSGKHDEQTKLAAERGREVEVLKQAKAQLEQQKAALSGKHDEQTKLAAECGREVEVLKQAKAQLDQEKAALQQGSTDLRKKLQEAQKLVPATFLHVLKGRLDAMPDASNLPDISLVSVEHANKVFFFTHFSTDYIPGKMAERNQFYEATFLDLLARVHHPDKLIIDGGANIGNHSVFFAGVIGASVIAFEPQPFNHEFLVANARLNHLEEKIDIRKKAIGDQPGSISLVQALPGNYGSFTADTKLAQRDDDDARARGLFDVRVSTLDVELKDREADVSIIKLDLEGMELEVLRGARTVIEKSLPVISVECFTRSFYEEIKEFLESFGYFAVDSTNATPTFIFLTRKNSRHMEILSGYLETSSIGKFYKNSVFNETK